MQFPIHISNLPWPYYVPPARYCRMSRSRKSPFSFTVFWL